MAVQIAPLIQSQVLTSGFVVYFTASGFTRIDAMTLYNPVGNAAALVTLAWVPSGGSIATANQITSHNMLPGETFIPFGFIGQTLAAGDKIYAEAATGALVNLFASGTIQS